MIGRKEKPRHITLFEVDGSKLPYRSTSFYVPGHGIVTKIERPGPKPQTAAEMIQAAIRTHRLRQRKGR